MKPLTVTAPRDNETLISCEEVDCVDGSLAYRDAFHDMFLSVNGHFYGPHPGESVYRIKSGVSPFLYGMSTFMTGGECPARVWVIYVGKNDFVYRFGTGELMCEDKTCGDAVPIRLAAGGSVTVRVDSSLTVLRKTGLWNIKWSDFAEEFLPPLIIPAVKSTLSEHLADSSVSSLQSALSSISGTLNSRLLPEFSEIGLSLLGTSLQSVSPDPEDLAKIQGLAEFRAKNSLDLHRDKERVRQLYGGNVRDRTYMDAILAAASNPGSGAGGILSLAALPAVLRSGRALADELLPGTASGHCPGCGAAHDLSDRFCPQCGRRINTV